MVGAATLGLAGRARAAVPLVLEAAPEKSGALSYNGTSPGPLIRVRPGQPVAVRLENKLAQPTSLTWHGVRIANAMDGVAGLTQKPVAPGTGLDLHFTPPDAGLFWYHPHAEGSAAQLGAGLYGLLIVEEATPPSVETDLPLVLAEAPAGAVLVNGKAAPKALTLRPGARLRLRLVNACPSRIAILGVTGATPTVVAVDGQPSDLFQPPGGSVPIGPGARFDLMLDMPATAGAKVALGLQDGPGRPAQVLLTATAEGVPLPARPPIAKLPANPLLPTRIALERATRHDVVLAPAANDRWSVNGIVGPALAKPLFSAKRGTPVVLTLRNATALPQPLLVHGHCWRLLHDLDDGWDPYWRDSVILGPGRTKHVAFVADNPGRWALESGDLARSAAGLVTWFEIR